MSSGAQLLADSDVLPDLSLGGLADDSGKNSSQHRLLVFEGYIESVPAKCLIDSRASHNFVSSVWIEKFFPGSLLERDRYAGRVVLADGVQQVFSSGVIQLNLLMGELSFHICATVIPMVKYNVILGMPWLYKYSPTIDFRSNIVAFQEFGKSFTAIDESLQGVLPLSLKQSEECAPQNFPDLDVISVKEAKQVLKNGGVCLVVSVNSVVDSDSQHLASIESVNIECDDSKKQGLMAVLQKHSKTFPDSLPNCLPPFREVNHDITIEQGHQPPSRLPYRLSRPELDELQKQLNDLLKRGFLEPSKSPFGAAVFFVKKADGTLRLVCDWRKLNKITIKTQACLPSIDDLFDAVQGSKYFTKLDLMSGYHQVCVNPQDIPKTAINTPFGHYQFTVMGFGLTNAPATFMALMNAVLRPFLRRCVVVFLDDILIYSKSWENHLQDIDDVLSALRKQSLFCKPTKCVFAASHVKFLGHIITGKSLAPDPEKLAAVKNWSVPKSVKEVRQFLGFSNYFRRFIKDYSSISRPLESLTSKYARFSWSAECQQAFEKLKLALTSAPVLLLPDVSKPFRVITDASDYAIGGVLLQTDCKGKWHPVAYTSRRFRPEELNYSAHEREAVAVVHALRAWKLYLFKHFELFTDNQAVSYIKSKKELSRREARWLDFLAEFDMEIKLKPGKDNIADALSRQGPLIPQPERLPELGNLEGEIALDSEMTTMLSDGYQSDKYMKNIIQSLQKNVRTAFHSRYHWSSSNKKLYLLDFPRWRLCVPAGKLRLRLLELCHDNISAGHPGRDRTYLRLSRYYYWPGMSKQVAKYVKSCVVCQRTKGDLPAQNFLQPLPLPKAPWQNIGMDLIVGLPSTSNGHDAILTFVDRLTKYAHFVPTSSRLDAAGAADLYITHVYRLHGLSSSVVCDRDPRFTADLFSNIFRKLNVQLQFTTANHPQCDGQTERTNRIIGQILRSAVNHRQSNWEEILPICEFAYNNMVQTSARETPFYLNYGWHPRAASDLLVTGQFPQSVATESWLENKQIALNIAKDAMQEAMVRQATNSDRHRTGRSFSVGDLVMVHRNFISTSISRDQPCAKLKDRWFGPFKILSVPSATTVKLDLPPSIRVHPVFNTSSLKPYHANEIAGRKQSSPPPPPIIDQDGHERYIVESVLSHRTYRGRLQYLVKWHGYTDPTWEPAEHLLDESGSPILPLQSYSQLTATYNFYSGGWGGIV